MSNTINKLTTIQTFTYLQLQSMTINTGRCFKVVPCFVKSPEYNGDI